MEIGRRPDATCGSLPLLRRHVGAPPLADLPGESCAAPFSVRHVRLQWPPFAKACRPFFRARRDARVLISDFFQTFLGWAPSSLPPSMLDRRRGPPEVASSCQAREKSPGSHMERDGVFPYRQRYLTSPKEMKWLPLGGEWRHSLPARRIESSHRRSWPCEIRRPPPRGARPFLGLPPHPLSSARHCRR